MYTIAAILLIVLGCVMIFKTELFWRITESWKSDVSHGPSWLFEISSKFGGVMFVIAGLVYFVAEVILKIE